MSNLANKISLYLGRTPDFLKEIILRDEGDGVVYIAEWNRDKARYIRKSS